MKITLAALILAVTTCSVAVAQSASNNSGRQSKAHFPQEIVSYFRGDWEGKGKFASGQDIASDYRFVPVFDKQCILVYQKEKPPNDFEFHALWSMDSVSGDMVMLLASNHDSGARLFRSQGWQNGKIVFQSVPELHAFWALERFTFERESPTAFHSFYEMSMDNGRTWHLGDQQIFTRKSPQ